MTRGQARHCLRQAQLQGLDAQMAPFTGRPDITAWESRQTPGIWCVTFWRHPMETCTAEADFQHRIDRGTS